ALLIYYVGVFYAKLGNYPPVLRNFQKHLSEETSKLSKVYGPVFTLWIGPLPFVFICDLDMGREVYNKPHFNGRPKTHYKKLFSSGPNEQSIVNADYGPCWLSGRKIAMSVISKYAKTSELSQLVANRTADMLRLIVEEQGINKPFKPNEYSYNLFANIVVSILLSIELNMHQDEFKALKYMTTDHFTELGATGIARDFCDIMIAAKHEAIEEDKRVAKFLNDDNLSRILVDLSLAASETTTTTLLWTILYMAYYPKLQTRLRNEIRNVLGDAIPGVNDKARLSYVMTFILEILRVRNPFPIGVPHTTTKAAKLGSYNIPTETILMLHQGHIMNDPDHWTKPDLFNPDRFLDANGCVDLVKPNAYIPFAIGKRICPVILQPLVTQITAQMLSWTSFRSKTSSLSSDQNLKQRVVCDGIQVIELFLMCGQYLSHIPFHPTLDPIHQFFHLKHESDSRDLRQIRDRQLHFDDRSANRYTSAITSILFEYKKRIIVLNASTVVSLITISLSLASLNWPQSITRKTWLLRANTCLMAGTLCPSTTNTTSLTDSLRKYCTSGQFMFSPNSGLCGGDASDC
ncbi:unnamed protein product, partial [Medioppia subpectinata]